MNKPKILAFYLPQYHRTPENDQWWGVGFTEWTNVAKARPLFKGHEQPKIPSELGFYDLTNPSIRKEQAELAQKYGVDGFCYWHYWFGNGKRLLYRPFEDVLTTGEPDFPFCLAWANHSWEKKLFDKKGNSTLLQKQLYPGVEDYQNHFYAMLPAFKDNRYIKVENKILFFVFSPTDNPEIKTFIKTWRELAKENGINDFFFVGNNLDNSHYETIMSYGFDAVYNNNMYHIYHHQTPFMKFKQGVLRRILHRPTVFNYRDAAKVSITDDDKKEDAFPMVYPNWDHSPRSGGNGIIFKNAKPAYFKDMVKKAITYVQNKKTERQIIVIKSWNEWGEGNYMEPDIKYGRGYLEALYQALKETGCID